MESIMLRCQRAPENYLALRLPLKSTLLPESEETSKAATPSLAKDSEKPKTKPAAHKPVPTQSPAANTSATTQEDSNLGKDPAMPIPAEPAKQKDVASTDVPVDNKEATNDDGRSRRASRKSTRVSTG